MGGVEEIPQLKFASFAVRERERGSASVLQLTEEEGKFFVRVRACVENFQLFVLVLCFWF